jgi:FKBP-type peptidyl-prolyl cis-trans isomerase SlyD
MVETVEEKAKGFIKLFAGRDMDLTFAEGTLTLTLPAGINYDRRWVMARGIVVHQIFEFIPEVQDIVFVETFKRPEKTAAEPAVAEAEAKEE